MLTNLSLEVTIQSGDNDGLVMLGHFFAELHGVWKLVRKLVMSKETSNKKTAAHAQAQ